ncbi:hypothetical protein HPB48_011377 [Haemaphysalis longicornis]|uniref:Uncharacterized protein n=1 Tax=Haemaphysalis longicornis TaxID=44386 RepID=A0A9J6GDP0_HAELO|nr:hypothetical protein HPB48_011377 [Haemaphysalis longicornis]
MTSRQQENRIAWRHLSTAKRTPPSSSRRSHILLFVRACFISPRKRGRTRLGALAARQPAGTTGPATTALASFTESPRLAPFNDGLSRLARTSLHRPATSRVCVCLKPCYSVRRACALRPRIEPLPAPCGLQYYGYLAITRDFGEEELSTRNGHSRIGPAARGKPRSARFVPPLNRAPSSICRSEPSCRPVGRLCSLRREPLDRTMQRGPVMSAPVSVVVNGSPVPLKVSEVVVTPSSSPSPPPPASSTALLPHVVRVSVVSPPAAVSPQSPPPATEADERSSSGASSGTGSDDEAPYDSDSGAEMKFHLRELEDTASSPPPDGVSVGRPLDADKAILSRQGTVRGVRNLVRASIKCIADCQEGKPVTAAADTSKDRTAHEGRLFRIYKEKHQRALSDEAVTFEVAPVVQRKRRRARSSTRLRTFVDRRRGSQPRFILSPFGIWTVPFFHGCSACSSDKAGAEKAFSAAEHVLGHSHCVPQLSIPVPRGGGGGGGEAGRERRWLGARCAESRLAQKSRRRRREPGLVPRSTSEAAEGGASLAAAPSSVVQARHRGPDREGMRDAEQGPRNARAAASGALSVAAGDLESRDCHKRNHAVLRAGGTKYSSSARNRVCSVVAAQRSTTQRRVQLCPPASLFGSFAVSAIGAAVPPVHVHLARASHNDVYTQLRDEC